MVLVFRYVVVSDYGRHAVVSLWCAVGFIHRAQRRITCLIGKTGAERWMPLDGTRSEARAHRERCCVRAGVWPPSRGQSTAHAGRSDEQTTTPVSIKGVSPHRRSAVGRILFCVEDQVIRQAAAVATKSDLNISLISGS